MPKNGKCKTPFKDVLPPLTTDEFAALKADIITNGVRDAILVDELDQILDGHHRYEIDPNAPRVVITGLTTDEHRKAFVIGCNHRRRNLSPTQKQNLLATNRKLAAEMKKQDPRRWTDKALGALFGVPRETVRDWFSSNGEVAKASKPDSRVKVDPAKKPEIAARVAAGESQAQVAADIGVTQRTVSSVVTSERKKTEAAKEKEAKAASIKTDCGVIHGDFRTQAVDPESVGLIFTDPPYDKEAASLYTDLAVFAAKVLVSGGWVLAYSGMVHLPQVYKAFSETEGIEYAWTFCCLHSGGNTRFRKYKLQSGWKPIIAAFKPPLSVTWDWFKDVVSGGREKTDHDWQQAESEAAHFIERLIPKQGVVCDPFCGSGTTLAAAKKLDRRWIGFDVDDAAVATARIKLI